ncbi:MAG TPA: hypothetical protein VFA10_06185 [Ktedonobacteraceae bacterium]|nr:hypothetical protein [Ktedonobacteraceae bacterium]
MSWLDNNLRKLRQQEADLRRQEELQRAQWESNREAEEALREQRQRQLAPIINSLQLRQLMQEANKKLRFSFEENLVASGNSYAFNEPLRLTTIYYQVWVGKYSTSRRDGGRGPISETHCYYIQIALRGELGQIKMEFKIFTGPSHDSWEEEITPYNHSALIKRLQQSIAQAVFGLLA